MERRCLCSIGRYEIYMRRCDITQAIECEQALAGYIHQVNATEDRGQRYQHRCQLYCVRAWKMTANVVVVTHTAHTTSGVGNVEETSARNMRIFVSSSSPQ